MRFKVKKLFKRGPEQAQAEFTKQEEAEHYIQEHLAQDVTYRVEAKYRLYEFGDLLKEFTQKDLIETESDSSNSSSSKQTFNPTPFNTTPRPGGVPHSWIQEQDDKKDKDK